MFNVLGISRENLIALKVTGKLKQADYDEIMPLLKEKLQQYSKIRWYLELEHFEGWTIKSFYQEITFDLKNASRFEMIAIVGDKEWEKWMAEISKFFTMAEVKFYKPENKGEAMAWIQSHMNGEANQARSEFH